MMIWQVWQLPGRISPNQSRIWAFQLHQIEEGVKAVRVGPMVARYDRSQATAVVPCGRTTRRQPYQVNPNNFREGRHHHFRIHSSRSRQEESHHRCQDPFIPRSISPSIHHSHRLLVSHRSHTIGSVVRQDYCDIESFYTMFMICDLIMCE